MDRGGGCLMIGNDGGGGKEMVRSSGGRSFQRHLVCYQRAARNCTLRMSPTDRRMGHQNADKGQLFWALCLHVALVHVATPSQHTLETPTSVIQQRNRTKPELISVAQNPALQSQHNSLIQSSVAEWTSEKRVGRVVQNEDEREVCSFCWCPSATIVMQKFLTYSKSKQSTLARFLSKTNHQAKIYTGIRKICHSLHN